MTAATPAGSSVVMIASASWLVRRSCSCGRRARISTARASFERPTTRPFGMEPTCARPSNGRKRVCSALCSYDVRWPGRAQNKRPGEDFGQRHGVTSSHSAHPTRRIVWLLLEGAGLSTCRHATGQGRRDMPGRHAGKERRMGGEQARAAAARTGLLAVLDLSRIPMPVLILAAVVAVLAILTLLLLVPVLPTLPHFPAP